MKYILWLSLLFVGYNTLYAQEKPEIVVTSGHIGTVNAINFSPNNKFVITGSIDKSIRIWDRSLCQEFRVLYGHKGSVVQVQYTSDSKYIISLDIMGSLMVWEHETGKVLNKRLIKGGNRFTYIAASNTMLVLHDGKMREYDVITKEEKGIHGTVRDYEVRLVPDTDLLITKTKNQKNHVLDVYNYKTKEVVSTLEAKEEEALLKIAISPDGKLVAGYSNVNQIITVWDRESAKVISSFKYKAPKFYLTKLEFTPDNKDLLVLTQMAEIYVHGVKGGLLKRRINESKPIDPTKMQQGAYRVGTAMDMAISPDNQMVGVAQFLTESKGIGDMPNLFMGAILYDFKKDRELGRLEGFFKHSSMISMSPNSKYLINSLINKRSGIRVWNMKEGDLDRFIPTSGIAGSSSDGAFFAAWVLANAVRPILTVYNAKTLKPVFETQEIEALSSVILNTDGSKMVTQEVSVDLKNPANNKYFFRAWDVKTKKQIGERIEFKHNEMPNVINGIKLSPDGNYIVAQLNSSQFTCWDLKTGERLISKPCQVAYDFLLDFVPNSTKILISSTKPAYNMEEKRMRSDMKWYEWDYLTGESSEPFDLGREGILFSGDFSDDGAYFVTGQGGYWGDEVKFDVVIWDWETKKQLCAMPGHHGEIKLVWFGPKNKRVYSSGADGFIKVWDVASCGLAASMIAQNELDYIIISPENYYKSSKGNNEGIGFRFQSSLYTFDQFDVHFNRPDKVLTKLGVSKYSVKLYTKAWEKRLHKMGFSPEDMKGNMALPSIKLPNKTELPPSTEEKQLKLNIEAWDETYNLDRISVYVNDVPFPKLQGISLKNKSLKKITRELDIDLSLGKNLIKVSVFNEQGLESLRESFQINYTPNSQKKPNLYIMTIGVSKFKNEERNLKFATKDATDLVSKFKESKYFGNVITEQIYDEKATKESVLELADFLQKAETDDQIIIYVSSHGLLDENLDYYLAMHDVDFDKPEARGLPYDALNSILDGLECRNRLVMIDACHSGEVDKDEAVTRSSIATTNSNVKVNHKSGTTMVRPKAGLKNSFTYMKTLFGDVSKGTGATVISAAGGYEFALESDDWNNGVFTYAILEGLSSGAADRDGNGSVYVSELKNYVTLKVVELTDGKQHPTTRSENSLNDFILFKVKPGSRANVLGTDK